MGFCPGPGWCVPVQRTAGAAEEEAAPAAGVVVRDWSSAHLAGQRTTSEPEATSCVILQLSRIIDDFMHTVKL